jgi:hypothetical protein
MWQRSLNPEVEIECLPKHEDAIVGSVSLTATLEVGLLPRNDLTLFRDLLLDDNHANVGLKEAGLAEVSDPAHLFNVKIKIKL